MPESNRANGFLVLNTHWEISNVTLLNDAIVFVERAERNRTGPQSVTRVQGSRRRNEFSGLAARPRFHRAVKSTVEQCTVNVDMARLKC